MVKAQIFFTDLIIALGIFTTAVVFFITFSSNLQPQAAPFDTLVDEADAISSSLLSAGVPHNWNYENVQTIGVTEESYRLNSSKVVMMMNLSSANASAAFGSNVNFAVYFEDTDGNILNFDGCTINNAELSINNITPQTCENFSVTPKMHLVSVKRLVLHNTGIVNMDTHVWQ